ncbi:MAG: hypothetical protein TECD_00145 [Hyphomicrobiaceae bacterium hypho_1]
MSEISKTVDTRRKRAMFRANYRGTKEMDWVLGKFAKATLFDMVDPKLSTFELLLTVADQQISDWISMPDSCDNPNYTEIITEIRHFHGLGNRTCVQS